MSDKSAKRRAPKAAQEGVLGTLPSTRPARIGRARSAATSARSAETKASRTAAPATARTKAPRTGTAGTKSSRTSTAGAKSRASAAPKTPPPERDGRRSRPPSGAELATTVVKAAGEVAAIGVGAGARALKRAARRVSRL
jgi:hypothetical protein